MDEQSSSAKEGGFEQAMADEAARLPLDTATNKQVLASEERNWLGVDYTLSIVDEDWAGYSLETFIPQLGKRFSWTITDDNNLADDGTPTDIGDDVADEAIEAIEVITSTHIEAVRGTIIGLFGEAGWQSYLASASNQVTLYEVVTCDTGDEYAAAPTVETHHFTSREQAQAKAVELGLAAIEEVASDDDEADPRLAAGLHPDDTVARQFQLVVGYCLRRTDFSVSVREVHFAKDGSSDE